MGALAVGEGTPAFLPEVAALVIAAAAISYLSARVRQVPIVGFLVAGVLIGPNALGLVRNLETVEAAAEIGVILLLFTIGIEFSLGRLMAIRRLILGGGGLQVVLATAAVAGLLAVGGVAVSDGVYTGFLIALSSTAIVLRLLGDRGETDTRAGRTTVGLLVFQDLAIIMMVLVTPMLGGEGGGLMGSLGELALALGRAAAIIAVVLVVARRLLPRLLDAVARACSQEVFLLVAVAICIGTAYLTSLAGVSVSLGAFLAGLMVSESRFDLQALGEILPLQIIFSAVFFVSVGMLLDVGFLVANLGWVLLAVVAVVTVKAVTTGIAVRALGEPMPVAGGAGLTLAQVGEFSFVLEGVGRTAGRSPAGLGDAGSQGFIAASVLLMIATPGLAALGTRAGKALARRTPTPVDDAAFADTDALAGHVIIAGYGSAARTLAAMLERTGVEFVITTLNPDGATEAEAAGRRVLRADATRRQTLEQASIDEARVLVVADDDEAMARRVIATAQMLRPELPVVVRVPDGDVEELSAAGARAVITHEGASAMATGVHVLRHFGLSSRAIAAELARIDAPDGGWEHDVVAEKLQLVDAARVVTLDPEVTDLSGCSHIDGALAATPSAPGCEECLRDGTRWVHLRICMACGHVGCCDSSPGRHASRHHRQTRHPVARSLEAGEEWAWCYVDEVTLTPREPAART